MEIVSKVPISALASGEWFVSDDWVEAYMILNSATLTDPIPGEVYFVRTAPGVAGNVGHFHETEMVHKVLAVSIHLNGS